MTLDSEMLLRALRMLMLACLGSLAVFLEAAPVDLSATGLLSPDLLLCVVAYWALRRPSATPLLLVFGLGLGRDLLTDAPLGAGALTLVLTAEILKQYRGWLRTRPFLVEWMVIAAAVFGGLLLQWLLIIITFGQPPYLSQLAQLAFLTLASYPLVVMIQRWGMRIGWQGADRQGPLRA